MFLAQKINLFDIFVGHWNTLIDDETHSRVPDVVVFYVVPTAITLGLTYYDIFMRGDAISVVTNALSILAGLLFNLLVLLQTLSASSRSPRNVRVRAFTQEVYDNIAYAIVISLVALVPVTIASNYDDDQRLGFRVASAVAMGLVIHFGLTMVMVLKRMYKLLQQELAAPTR